jgi:hypothetical protein
MADHLARSLLRAVRWAVDEARMLLAADEPHCDLEGYRDTLAMVADVLNPSPALRETAACLEAEIEARRRMQERARAVLDDTDTRTGDRAEYRGQALGVVEVERR